MSEPVIAPEAGQASESPASKESMKDFLDKVAPDEEAEGASPEGEQAEKEQPDQETSKVAEEDEEDSEEKESDEKKEASDENSKKPNRYQRMKAKLEVAEKRSFEAKQNEHKALVIANQWRAHAQAVEAEFKRVLDATKYQLDPRDVELFHARRNQALTGTTQQLEQARHQQMQQEQIRQQTEELAAEFTATAVGLAKKYPGLPAKKILQGYAAVVESGEDVTLEQVAENMAHALRHPVRASAEKQQLEANASAPNTLKPGRASPPKYGRDTAGMQAFLHSKGLL